MSPNEANKLAIVIPAYKARFLRQALESIAQQTDKRFKVYIGDDASPDNIREICVEFTDRFDLIYKRFDVNLGQSSLVAHWNRCIDMSAEPWVWLFCDDDVMGPECVEMFHETIDQEKDKFRLLRFNTLTINDDGDVIRVNPPHPMKESGIQFIYHRLNYQRSSYVSEYIFSREAYSENEGMIDFPIAYCSDDASWLAFSKTTGIFTIQKENVFWREGALNISPSGPKYQSERIEATSKFVDWLNNFLQINEIENKYITRDIIRKLSVSWFLRQVRGVAPIRISNIRKAAYYINKATRRGWKFSYTFIFLINQEFYIKMLKRMSR